MRSDGLSGSTFLKQDLTPQLPEIRVIGLFGQKSIDGVQGLLGLAVAIPGDRTRVAAGQGHIALGIVAKGLDRIVHEGVDLGQDQGMLGHALRTVRSPIVGLLRDKPAQVFDPVR